MASFTNCLKTVRLMDRVRQLEIWISWSEKKNVTFRTTYISLSTTNHEIFSKKLDRMVNIHELDCGKAQEELANSFLVPSNMMILAWNCRGIARPSFGLHISHLIRTHKPDILILTETRTSHAHTVEILRKLSFDSSEIVDPIGFSGGIIVLWNARQMDVTVINKGRQCVNIVVQVISSQNSFLLSAIYAHPKFRYRKNLWCQLISISETVNLPWVCIGDFNEVVSRDEKFGGLPIKLNRTSLFANSMNQCGLFDLGFSGQKYTWTNRRRRYPILERLDRAWSNQGWLDLYPNTHVRHLTRLSSDHCPILLETNININHSTKRFKFESLWLKEPSFLPFTTSVWSSYVGDIPQKIDHLSSNLTNWAHETVGNLFRTKNRLTARLNGVQNELCHHPSSHFLSTLNDSLTTELNKILDQEQLHWRDRSRHNWLIDGDRNTSFFQKSVIHRRNFNRIIALEDDVRNIITSQDELLTHTLNFFTTLYHTEKAVVILTPTNYTPTIVGSSTPNESEIRDALFSLGSNKAPGPDGFHAGFFKTCWDVVKTDIIPFVQHIFETKTMHKDINSTNISLIPKIPNPTTIRHFRPSSLCNTTYKIITKIIVGRLKPHMHSIISPNQGSSIPGRGTDTNYIIASELLHSMKSCKNKGWFAIKLDLEKAFDRLE